MKTYYKVVENQQGCLRSACKNSRVWNRNSDSLLTSAEVEVLKGKFKLEYAPGRWTKPVVAQSCLFIFDSARAALTFVKNQYTRNEGMEIWECETNHVQKPLPRPAIDAEDFWKMVTMARKKKVKMAYRKSINWPDGTLTAKEVKLTRLHSKYVYE